MDVSVTELPLLNASLSKRADLRQHLNYYNDVVYLLTSGPQDVCVTAELQMKDHYKGHNVRRREDERSKSTPTSTMTGHLRLPADLHRGGRWPIS